MRFVVGEQVSVNPNIYLRDCDYCLAGRLILCENLKGLGSNFPGFFAEFVTVPASLVFSVEGLAARYGGVHRARRLRDARAGDAEPSSRLERAGLRRRPNRPPPGAAHRVRWGVPRSRSRRRRSSSWTVPPRSASTNTVLIDRNDRARQPHEGPATPPNGDGYDFVVEATGSTAIGDICVPLTRNGGTVMVYGVTRGRRGRHLPSLRRLPTGDHHQGILRRDHVIRVPRSQRCAVAGSEPTG